MSNDCNFQPSSSDSSSSSYPSSFLDSLHVSCSPVSVSVPGPRGRTSTSVQSSSGPPRAQSSRIGGSSSSSSSSSKVVAPSFVSGSFTCPACPLIYASAPL